MTLPKRTRTVNFFDLVSHQKFVKNPMKPIAVPTGTLLIACRDIYLEDKRLGQFRVGEKHLMVSDWEFDKKRQEHHICISSADSSLADVAFKHIRNGKSRMAGKHEDEAIETTSHVLIKILDDQPPLFLITAGTAANGPRVATMFGRLARHAARDAGAIGALFKRPHPNGIEGRFLSLRAKFECAAHQSHTLQSILKTGRLDSVELIAEGDEGFDGDDGVAVESRSLKVQVINKNKPFSFDRFKKLFKPIDGFDVTKARVAYREAGSDRTISKMFAVPALGDAFGRSEQLNFDVDLPSRDPNINPAIIDKMRKLI